MNNEYCKRIDELFELFEDIISPEDALAAKLMSQVSSGITRERLQLQMNQSEFSEYINVSQSQISRWEHGDYNFSLRKIAEIAAALDLDANFTFSHIPPCHTIGQYKATFTPKKSVSGTSVRSCSYQATTYSNIKENKKSCYNMPTTLPV